MVSAFESAYSVVKNDPELLKVYNRAVADSRRRRKALEKKEKRVARPIVPAQPIRINVGRKIDQAAEVWLSERYPDADPANAPSYSAMVAMIRARKVLIASVRYRLRSVGIK